MPQNRFRNWSEQVRQKQAPVLLYGKWQVKADGFLFCPAITVGLKKDFHAECASLFLGSNWISMFPHCLRHSGEKLTSLIGVRLNMKAFRGSRISNWNILMGVLVVFYLFGISILFLADLNFKSSVAFALWFLGRNVLISELVCTHILFHWLRWLSPAGKVSQNSWAWLREFMDSSFVHTLWAHAAYAQLCWFSVWWKCVHTEWRPQFVGEPKISIYCPNSPSCTLIYILDGAP